MMVKPHNCREACSITPIFDELLGLLPVFDRRLVLEINTLLLSLVSNSCKN